MGKELSPEQYAFAAVHTHADEQERLSQFKLVHDVILNATTLAIYAPKEAARILDALHNAAEPVEHDEGTLAEYDLFVGEKALKPDDISFLPDFMQQVLRPETVDEGQGEEAYTEEEEQVPFSLFNAHVRVVR